MEISFRPIGDDDFDLLWRVHVAGFREHVEKTWGWDDEVQLGFLRESHRSRAGKIVLIDGIEAGVWHVVEYDDEILLSSIRLLPEFQNRGLGTKLITDLLDSTPKPVRLQVLKVNPARVLYERLGFEIFEETDTHYKMIRRPPSR